MEIATAELSMEIATAESSMEIATAIKRASRINFTVVIKNMRWCVMNVTHT